MTAMSHADTRSSPLISEEYRELQRKLHENPGYGVASVQYALLVAEIVRVVGATEMLATGRARAVWARRCARSSTFASRSITTSRQ